MTDTSTLSDNHLSPSKKLPQNRDTLMKSMKDPLLLDSVRRSLSPAQKYDRMFSEEECEWLFNFAFSGGLKSRRNSNGTVFVYGPQLQVVYEKFKDRIDSILPEAKSSPTINGNFFLTPSQYGIHNDSPIERDFNKNLEEVPLMHPQRRYAPWKNLIIPLWQALPYARSQIVFFDQRHIDWAHVYNHGNSMPNISTQYPIVEDYGQIQFYDGSGHPIPKQRNLLPYDKSHYDQYLSYTPFERLTGLSPEMTCDWEPGSPMTFDAVQLHATNRGNPEWRVKMGLLLTFLKEIE